MKTLFVNKLLLLLVCLLPGLSVQAQKYRVEGFIQDSFTHESLDSVTLEFMTLDSIVMQTHVSKPLGMWQFYNEIDPPGRCIIRFIKEGYYDAYKQVNFNYVAHRITGGSFGTVYMSKKKDVQLDEVAVKATKIMMVRRNDTIIYNASAFELQEGSMLNALISQLPGVSLESGGVITVNGRQISNLLVNGEDFFKGDPKIALDNLPSYTIDNIKVYERSSDRAVALGLRPEDFQAHDLPLVMDVKLKKEYSIGWIMNVGGGYGTDNHFAARAFALRFTKQSRVALFGNMNDTQSDSYYDMSSGNWRSSDTENDVTTKSAGLDILVSDKDGHYKITGNATVKNTKTYEENKTSSTTFFDDGDTYGRTSNNYVYRNTQVKGDFTLNVTPRTGLFFEFKPNVTYSHFDNRSLQLSADFQQQLTERYMGEALDSLFSNDASGIYRQNLISSLRTASRHKGHWVNAGGTFSSTLRPRKTNDEWTVQGGGNYYYLGNRTLNNNLTSSLAENDVRQDRFSTSDNRNYKFNVGTSYLYRLDYVLGFNSLRITPSYNFSRSHSTSDAPTYLLEETEYADWDVDLLSSAKAMLNDLDLLDVSNATRSTKWNNTHRGGLNFYAYTWSDETRVNLSYELGLPLRHVTDNIDYERGSLDTVAQRKKFFFEPYFSVRRDRNYSGTETHWIFLYQYTSSAPELQSTLAYRDDATPLVVRLGNSNLNDAHTHHINALYSCFRSMTEHYTSITLDYYLYKNSLCQAMTYDMTTGVRTYRPETIDGNWEVNAYLYQFHRLDKKKCLMLYSETTVNYRNSADLQSVDDVEQSVRSSVRRTLVKEDFRLNWRLFSNTLFANFLTGVEWTHYDGNLSGSMNVWQYNYGVSFLFKLPWNINLNSSLRMYSRRGYSDDTYNTNNFIWNADMTKSILKGKLTFTLEAFDILDNISNTSYSINAQMQSETWRNVLSRYVMLHVVYRLNINPKSK